jgi:hypothetical protein
MVKNGTALHGASEIYDYLINTYLDKEILVSLLHEDILLSSFLMTLDEAELPLTDEALAMSSEEIEELTEEECNPLYSQLVLSGETIELTETRTCTMMAVPLDNPIAEVGERNVVIHSGAWTLYVHSAHEAIRQPLQRLLSERFRLMAGDYVGN